MNVAVVGFGYIGSVIGAVLASTGNQVWGVEPNLKIVESVNRGESPFSEPGLSDLIRDARTQGVLEATDDPSIVSKCETIVITVGTPLGGEGDPDVSQVRAAVEAIAPHFREGSLIVLKSTVPPFTTEAVVAPVLRKQERPFRLAFCPERLAEGRAIQDFRSLPIVIGGVDPDSAVRAAEFWETMLGVQVIVVPDSRTAEMVKLADNMWIDLNIALAGELAKLSDHVGVDVLEVIRAANSLPKGSTAVNILTPSVGVGGYCLTKDPWFLHRLGLKHGVEMALPSISRQVNDSMPHYSAELIDEFLRSRNTNGRQKKVAVLGIAFKSDTGDCRYSPTAPVIAELRKRGHLLEICDPWVRDGDSALVTDLPVGADIEATIRGADCVAFLSGHSQFQSIPIIRIAELARPGALVFDGRMFFNRQKIDEMQRYGLSYKGVGR